MDLPSTLLLSPDFTARPVDARWQRVVDLAGQGRRARHRFDDQWVKQGLRYLRRLNRCHEDEARNRLAEALPAIDVAYRLRHGDPFSRAVVEARLLAGQSISEVASACEMTSEAVGAYEALFFSVLDRREARSFIMIEAMGGNLWDGSLTPEDGGVWMRFFAYLKGPLFLEPLIQYYRGWTLPERLEDVTAEQLSETVDMLQVRALILSRALPFPALLPGLKGPGRWPTSVRLHFVRNVAAGSGRMRSDHTPPGKIANPSRAAPEAFVPDHAVG